MTYGPQITAHINRYGKEAEVKTRSEGSTNEFGNTTDTHTADRTVIAARTYPNRNTQVENNVGTRDRDRPVFIVSRRNDVPKPPQENDQIVFEGKTYEVKAHTEYDTHVEFFGEPVLHDEQGI